MQVNIDFNILSSSPKTISIFDSSDWHWAEDRPANLLIIPPGSKKCITIPFEKGTLNVVNSNDLMLGDMVELLDGIYEITLASGYTNIANTKYYLKTDRLKKRRAKVIIEANETGSLSEEVMNSITRLDWYLSVAESYTLKGNSNKAMQAFNMASRLVEDLSCC